MNRRTILAVLPGLVTLSAAHAQTHLTSEHVDFNIRFTAPSSFLMEVVDEDNGVNYSPSSVILDVPEAAQSARPGSSAFDFIGVAAGQTYWRLPQSQNPNLLYLGVAGYGVSSGSIDSYNASAESGGRVSGTGAWTKLTLESVKGVGGTSAPGFFSVWQNGDTGPITFLSSFTGGITSNDALWIVAGGHSHFNWGFSAPGDYEVTFRPSVRRSGATVTSADPFTFLFQVQTAAPEPGSLSLLALPLVGIALQCVRRRSKESRNR
jgi:surface-anchored protein